MATVFLLSFPLAGTLTVTYNIVAYNYCTSTVVDNELAGFT